MAYRDDPCYLSGADAARRIAAGTLSPVEYLDAILDRIAAVEPALNCFTVLAADDARAAARAAEAAVGRGDRPGPLHGVPFTVKDMIDVAGRRITYGSAFFEHRVAERDAVAVARMRTAGGIFLGVTNMAEMGHKGTNSNPLWGVTRNPWNLERTPGGSSGGAVAALAAGCGPLALGTDRAGSVRIPAAATGVVGLKPTLGTIPNPDQPDLFDTTAVIGPMARCVADVALAMTVLAGPDSRDPWSHGARARDYRPDAAPAPDALAGARIAWAPRVGNAFVEVETLEICEAAATAFRDLGADVREVDLDLSDGVDILLPLITTLAHAGFADRLAALRDRIDPSFVEVVERGAGYGGADVQRAMQGRADMFRRVEAVLADHALLLTPTLTRPAIDADHYAWDPVTVDGVARGTSRHDWFPYTMPFNHTGHPALSVPAGWTEDGLPVGLQIVAAWHREDALVRAGAALEAARPWSHRRPPSPETPSP